MSPAIPSSSQTAFAKAEKMLAKLRAGNKDIHFNESKDKADNFLAGVQSVFNDEQFVPTVQNIKSIKDMLYCTAILSNSEKYKIDTKSKQDLVKSSYAFLSRHQDIVKETSLYGRDHFLIELLEIPLRVDASGASKKEFSHFIFAHPDVWYEDANDHKDFSLLQSAMNYQQESRTDIKESFKNNNFDVVVTGDDTLLSYDMIRPAEKARIRDIFTMNVNDDVPFLTRKMAGHKPKVILQMSPFKDRPV